MADYTQAYERAAKKHGIPIEVLRGMIETESNGNASTADGVGQRGQKSVGIAQMQHSTAKGLGFKGTEAELRSNPEIGIDLAAQYLAENARKANGDYSRAVAGYYSGPGAMHKLGTPEGDKPYDMYVVDHRTGKLVKREAPSINEHVRRFQANTQRMYPGYKFGPLGLLGQQTPPLTTSEPAPATADAFQPIREGMRQGIEGVQKYGDIMQQAYAPVYRNMQRGINDLQGQLGGAMSELQRVLASSSTQYAPEGPNATLQGLAGGMANLGSAIANDPGYREQFNRNKETDIAQRRQEGMQRRAELLQVSLERWGHIRDRLEQQGDKMNALQAQEKHDAIAAQIEEMQTKMQGEIQLANASALEKQKAQSDIAKLYAQAGWKVKFGADGDIESASPPVKPKGGTLMAVNDAAAIEQSLFDTIQKTLEKGDKIKALGIGSSWLQAKANWREGDDAAAPLRRLKLARADIKQLFPNADADAMIQVVYTNMLQAALANEQVGEDGTVTSEYVPGIRHAAEAMGIIPAGKETPPAGGKPEPAAKPGAAGGKPVSVAEMGNIMLMSSNGEQDEAFLPSAKKILSQYVKVTRELDQRSKVVRDAGGNPDLTNIEELRDKKKKLLEQLKHLGYSPVDMVGSN